MEATGEAAGHDAATALDRALHHGLRSAYQPIVDLGHGRIAGFEAFLRYGDPSPAGGPGAPGHAGTGREVALPNASDLIESARRLGRIAELEAAALRAALAHRAELPEGCFLSVNVGTVALADPAVTAILDGQATLEGVVLELTDTDAATLRPATEVLAACRARGASVAVAHGGLAYADLAALFAIEPAFVKLAREVIDGVATDNVKLALVETSCQLATRLGVRLVAEGIEDLADLQTLQRLGVDLGQGFLLARPAPLAEARRPRLVRAEPGTGAGEARTCHAMPSVLSVVEHAVALGLSELDRDGDAATRGTVHEVIVGELHQPLALMRRKGNRIESLPLTIVPSSASIVDAARIALARPAASRFAPMVCVDELATMSGIVRIERLVAALADAAGSRAVAPSARRHRGR